MYFEINSPPEAYIYETLVDVLLSESLFEALRDPVWEQTKNKVEIDARDLKLI